ncbi:MAG TPA: hypothetical protein VF158_07445 [Longimicrobiales bacterium]
MEPAYPFIVSALAGATLALGEMVHTFGRFALRLFRGYQAYAILAVNSVFAISGYVLVQLGLDDEASPGASLMIALVAGLGFPSILRSRITFYSVPARHAESKPIELALPLDTLYRALRDLCYNEADIELADARNRRATQLASRYTPEELETELRQQFAAGLLPTRRLANEQKLDEVLSQYAHDPRHLSYLLAVMAVDVLSKRRVDELLAGRSIALAGRS